METPEQLAQPNSPSQVGQQCPRTMEERRLIVEESLAPGATVAVVAQAHGVHVSQLARFFLAREKISAILRER